MRSRLVGTVIVVTTCALSIIACGGSHRDSDAREQRTELDGHTPECSRPRLQMGEWPVVSLNRLEAARVSLRLPPQSEEIEATEGQNWRLAGGSFAYRVSAGRVADDPARADDVWCLLRLGPELIPVRYFFGDATFGRRGYLTAEIPMAANRRLEIIASTYDSAGVDTLLAIIGSISIDSDSE